MDYTKATGWLQFGAGVAAIFMQIWAATHGVHMDMSQTALATGVGAHGLAKGLEK